MWTLSLKHFKMSDSISEVFGCLFYSLIVCVILLACSAVYIFFRGNTIETTKRLVPEIRLTTDGKTIDTIYIYRKPDD